MIDEALLHLALQACHDRDSQQVLGDAVIESGWSDWRVTALLTGRRRGYYSLWFLHYRSCEQPTADRVRSQERAANLSRKNARNPTRRWCRAVAAVLLFGEWTTQKWPVAYKAELFLSTFQAEWLNARAAMSEALFGINREPEPTRLAGLEMWTPTSADQLRAAVDLFHNQIIDRDQLLRIFDAPTMQTVLLANPDEVRQFGEARTDTVERAVTGVAMVTSIGRDNGPTVEQRPNPLVEVWDREMSAMEDAYVRRRTLGGLPAPSSLRVARRR